MATLILWTGGESEILPRNSEAGFTFEELYAVIGCEYIEIVPLADGRLMVLDEEGRLTNRPPNFKATRLYAEGRVTGLAILGNVVVAWPEEIQ